MGAVPETLTSWLLASDPALKWQVERDMAHEPPDVWEATRERVATEGFGARLLALQDPDGQWAGGAFFPAHFDFAGPEAADGAGQPWTATTWTLTTLRTWGLPASALTGTAQKLAASSHWEYDPTLPYWGGEVDACINAATLANGAWLGADVSGLAQWFVDHQMAEGGWNCEWVNGSVRSSFNSTLNSLQAILSYEKAGGDGTAGTDALRAARKAGEEYLLTRGALRRKTTGELVQPWFGVLAYPFRWHYTALRALDYFREAALHDGAAPDPRLAEAVGMVRYKRREDGTWLQEHRFPGRVWFDVDVPPGERSKWLTFHAHRALDWWDSAESP
ncbi:squalene cyclase [Sinomonas cellulolyticus]|uniref:squalene cyclase n=1 Tax=Sinomonas cellulolyticus TaxID=2801916 RepID=UPI001E3B0F77